MKLKNLIDNIINDKIDFDNIENDFTNNNKILVDKINNEIDKCFLNLGCTLSEILLCQLSHENIYDVLMDTINDNLDDVVNDMINVVEKYKNENVNGVY